MNLLTQSLLKELLGEQKTVAIYGGGFKPPTKGHFHVAELTLEKFPEIDELKIFVGGGVRDGVTQDESIRIWDIYKKYLSPKVDIEASVAPVKSVLGYAKENPDTKVYWILGARDGDEGDLADIENRTKSLSKYPNLEVKVITTSGGVSGTKTRQAIRDNNKEQFFHMIPDVNDAEKEEIWNMVSPIIKEGFIDDVKTKFQKFIAAIKQEGQETKEVVGLLIHAAQGKIELTDKDKEYIGNQLKDVLKTIGLVGIATLPGGFIAGALIKLFKAEHLVTPSAFVNEVGEANLKPYKWQELDMTGYVVFARFVTDSKTQYDVDLTTTSYRPKDSNSSIKALLIEFIAKPKGAEGSSAYIVVNKGEMYRVMATIVDIVKKYTKKQKAKAILYSPSKKQGEEFGTQRDQLYKAFISKAIPGVKFEQKRDLVAAILPDTINELVTDTEVICDNCGWKWKIAEGGDDLYTCHKCGHDNNPNLQETNNILSAEQKIDNLPQGKLFDDAKNIESIFNKSRHSWSETIESFEKNKDKSEEQNIDIKDIHITQPNIQSNKVKNMITNIDKLTIINVVEFADGEKVIHDGHHRLIANWALGNTKIKVNLIKIDELKENDPFGIKAYARELVKEVFDKAWNLQEGMLSLSKYMIDNGMNIKPLPKIKVIKDDEENASNLLGKTAYYNPVEKSITLYTMDRHPKDILRSFAHEMIHHEQNLEGKLNNISTTNTNEGGDLPEIEREAYEKGNMMLRNWEDSIKNV